MADGVTQSSAAAALKLCSLAATWKVFKNLSDGKRMATTQNYTMSMEQQSCQPLKPFAYQALAKEKTRPMPCSRAVRASAARYWRVGGLITRAEPAADAPSIAARRQHRVLATLAEKAHQPAGNRLDIAKSIVRREDPQRPSGKRLPLGVQVQRQRYLALRTAPRLIQMARISQAGRIPRIVQLQLEQPQVCLAVQFLAQLFQLRKQQVFRRV